MIRFAAVFGLIGLFVATGLIVWSGYEDVLKALSVARWGIVWTSLYHSVPMIACALGWQALLPGRKKATKLLIFYVSWIRSSINNLMPVARIGGEIVSVRLMVKGGVRKAPAIAAIVVELSLSILSQFLFVLIGVGLLLFRVSDDSVGARLLWGVVLSAPLIGGMLYIQKVGVFGILEKLIALFLRDKWKKLIGSGAKLDHAVRTMYRRRDKIVYCFIMQFLSWALVSGEVWLALLFLGHPLPLWECMMIEALIQAASSAAFMVPGALGVQEAGFLLVGQALGLTPEIAAALAIIRRCRDVLLYVPGLIVWQVQEGKWLLKK